MYDLSTTEGQEDMVRNENPTVGANMFHQWQETQPADVADTVAKRLYFLYARMHQSVLVGGEFQRRLVELGFYE